MSAVAGKALPEGIVHLGEESWSTVEAAKRLLEQGQIVSIVGCGRSMEPMIPDGTRMILEPRGKRKLKKGDVVLSRILFPVKYEDGTHGKEYGWLMHMIYLVRFDGTKYLIGNNHGDIDGWAYDEDVFGIYVGAIE